MSLLVGLAAAGGFVTARWIVRRLRARNPSRVVAPHEAEPPADDLFSTLPCKVGDVLVRRAERDDAWLAGALVFLEDRPVSALFVAPEAGGDRTVHVRAGGGGVTWLSPISPGSLAMPSDPPHAIEHERVRYERVRRLPVRVVRVGTGAPDVGDRAIVAEYAAPGAQRMVVVAGSALTLCWTGTALHESEYDVLPGG